MLEKFWTMLKNAELCLETRNNALKYHRITLMLKIFEMTWASGKPVPRAAAAYGRQLKMTVLFSKQFFLFAGMYVFHVVEKTFSGLSWDKINRAVRIEHFTFCFKDNKLWKWMRVCKARMSLDVERTLTLIFVNSLRYKVWKYLKSDLIGDTWTN